MSILETATTEDILQPNNLILICLGIALLIALSAVTVLLVRKSKNRESGLSRRNKLIQKILDSNPHFMWFYDNKTKQTLKNKALQTSDFADSEIVNITASTTASIRKPNSSSASTHSIEISTSRYDQPNGSLKYIIGTAKDISDELVTERKVRTLEKVFDIASESIVIISNNGSIRDINRSFSEATGFSKDDVIGKNVDTFFAQHEHILLEEIIELVKTKNVWKGELEIQLKNGDTLTVGMIISSVKNQESDIQNFVISFEDFAALRKAKNELQYQSKHDALTGLANRQLLESHLHSLIESHSRHDQKFSVLFLDIDKFKHINDSLGHQFGDSVLDEVGKRITQVLRPQDFASRLGGDEFVIVLGSVTGNNRIKSMSQQLIDALAQPMQIEEQTLTLHCSIGISIFPDHGQTVNQLIKHADSAMYAAKDNGRNCFSFYTETLTQIAQERLILEQELSQVIAEQRLDVHYQPIVDLATGDFIKAEALIRWPLSKGRFLPPDKFIPIAEETGDIVAIGNWILFQSCEAIVRWRKMGLSISNIAVNVSKVQFARGDIYEKILSTLEKTHCDPSWISIEITESTIMGLADTALEQLRNLRALGIGISIDDFGTGQSSLSMLKTLPFTILKVDRAFVKDTPDDKQDVEITKLIVNLGHMLNVKMVAEGIETTAQKDLLQSLHCQYGQGYLYSKPLPADELESFITKKMRALAS